MHQTVSCHVRWMTRGDIPDCLEVEQGSAAWPDPDAGLWTAEHFRTSIRHRKRISYVATGPDNVAHGFAVMEVYKTKIVLLHLAVRRDMRRHLVGTTLLDRVKSRMGHRKLLTTAVRESNLGAQLFLRENGFRCVAVDRRKYQFPEPEDRYQFAFVP